MTGDYTFPARRIPDPLDKPHDWIKLFGLKACRKCGVVKRRDGENKPCPGPVRVVLRENRIK